MPDGPRPRAGNIVRSHCAPLIQSAATFEKQAIQHCVVAAEIAEHFLNRRRVIPADFTKMSRSVGQFFQTKRSDVITITRNENVAV